MCTRRVARIRVMCCPITFRSFKSAQMPTSSWLAVVTLPSPNKSLITNAESLRNQATNTPSKIEQVWSFLAMDTQRVPLVIVKFWFLVVGSTLAPPLKSTILIRMFGGTCPSFAINGTITRAVPSTIRASLFSAALTMTPEPTWLRLKNWTFRSFKRTSCSRGRSTSCKSHPLWFSLQRGRV